MRDVARRTGLSIATVSLALHDHPRITEATRKVVRQAAKALGYRADPLLAALSAHRWHQRPISAGSTLALLADGVLEGERGMVNRAATFGYRAEIFNIRDYPDPARLSQVLVNRGILGLVVGQIFTPGFCAAFDWSRFVAVACSEGCERPPVNLVMPNHFLAIQDGWDHARALGYRRIGLVLLENPIALDCRDRRAAFMERQLEVTAGDRVPIMAITITSRLKSNKANSKTQHQSEIINMGKWLKRHRPDVVLGFNCSTQWIIHDAGWRVPEKVAFITLWTDDSDHETTGLVLSADEVGARAIDWLDLLIRSGERGLPQHPATMSVDMIWQPGETAPGVKH